MSEDIGVAIIGVGCTKFGENLSVGYADMLAEAAFAAFEDAGVGQEEIDGAWLGTCLPGVGNYDGDAGSSLAEPLHLYSRPVTRVSNYCATGADALRHACLGVRSGDMRFALAVGVEKMRDVSSRDSAVHQTVYRGHPTIGKGISAAGFFALYAQRHFDAYGLTREHLARIAVKNHRNGARNPKAHFQREITEEQALSASPIAAPLGLFDACPTTDGAAAAIVTTPAVARHLGVEYVLVKGIALAVSGGYNVMFDPTRDFMSFPAVVDASRKAYEQAGVVDPIEDIDFAEVHDCFTIAEAIMCEDLGFVQRGKVKDAIDDGVFELEGPLPINPSGGLKASGHPIGATGLRMTYEAVMQLRGRAGEHQVPNARRGLIENLGGPGVVSAVAVLEASE